MLHNLRHHHGHECAAPTAHSADRSATTSKGPRRRSSGLRFFASSSASHAEPAANPHKKWETEYLKDLRANRPARPSGSRPLPDRAASSLADPFARASSAMSFRPLHSLHPTGRLANDGSTRSASALSHRRAQSDMPVVGPADVNAGGTATHREKPFVASRDFSTTTHSSKATTVEPSGTYRESGMRWMEKQEARSLREALEDMDSREEAKLYAAAQDEATEFVRKHRDGEGQEIASKRPRTYREHLQKGAHARSQSQAWHEGATEVRIPGQRSVSDKSTSTTNSNGTSKEGRGTGTPSTEIQNIGVQSTEPRSHMEWDSPQKKAYMNLTFPMQLRKTSGRRRSSGPRARDVSGGLFRNPEDKIYEEPNESNKEVKWADSADSKIPVPLATKARNTVSKFQTASQPFLRSGKSSAEDKRSFNRSEIHRNPPSRSRNPSYLKNDPPATPPERHSDQSDHALPEKKTLGDGLEVRSDDIRAATSMRMKDRSPKLPSPTVVSGRPGRPIVSFDQDWKPNDTKKHDGDYTNRPSAIPTRLRHKPQMPESTASAPIVPTINVPEPPSVQVDDVFACEAPSMPSISVSDVPIPSISLPDDAPSARPLPDLSTRSRPPPANRPLPHHSSTAPVHSSVPHWSASQQRATAQCSACALSIAGRIVSAASLRFHPQCFTCHHCAEPLECVAFYPEPDSKRKERLARIEARTNGDLPLEEKPGKTAVDDGDASLRFYCHLDFHEFFSPRCKSCKTPIESEVVIACGSTWHVGHFFCAECGDPFDPKTPFVEKDGYAWCVNCHAGKFSGKCKGCRKPVVTEGIRALDADWHGGCFVCAECSGGFEDGRFFTREGEHQRPVCVGCEERRLKA